MELTVENLNNEYLRIKMALEKYETDLEKYDADLKEALKNREDAKNALQAAKTNKEKKQFQEDLNRTENAVIDIKAQVELAKSTQEANRASIGMIMSELKSRPEIQEQYKKSMSVRTDRKIAKFEKQKQEQEAKKSTLIQLKSIIAKHPQAQIFVNEIENKSLEISKREVQIKDIDEKIAKLDPEAPDYAAEKASLEADKVKLDGECVTLKAERKSSRDNLKKLINNPKYNEHIDNLTTRAKLDKDINNANRLINRSENKIKDYSRAKEELQIGKEKSKSTPPVLTATKWDTFKNNIKSIFSKKYPGDSSRLSKLGKTIKDLFSKKAIPSDPEPTPVSKPEDEKAFRDVMKYEVIRELYNKEFDNEVSKAKKERELEGSEHEKDEEEDREL